MMVMGLGWRCGGDGGGNGDEDGGGDGDDYLVVMNFNFHKDLGITTATFSYVLIAAKMFLVC